MRVGVNDGQKVSTGFRPGASSAVIQANAQARGDDLGGWRYAIVTNLFCPIGLTFASFLTMSGAKFHMIELLAAAGIFGRVNEESGPAEQASDA